MTAFATGMAEGLRLVRLGLFWLAVTLAIVFAIDWAVRTRRLNPFGPIARFFRSSVDPLLAPIERRVVRAGGVPSSAPWWALVVVVVGGLVLLTILDYVQQMVAEAAVQLAAGGPRGVALLLVRWTFLVLEVAIFVRVLSSWLGVAPYGRWVRWSYQLTEWLLRPLRRIVPPLGMVDVTPLVALLLLAYVAQPLVMSLLARAT